jgi:hypothetical protein
MGGDLYLHNSDDADRLNLFGERKDCVLEVTANQEPRYMKLLDSIMLDTDGTWEVESVIIPPSLNYPDGMYSKIPKRFFIKREGVYQSEFLRNMKTTSGTASSLQALTGDPLRGNEAVIRLKNSDGSLVRLFRITINMTKSR